VRIDVAKNGKSAVERLRSERYDLVLMDIELPVMDGFSAVREIRRMERERAQDPTPIVAMSAHALAGDAERSLAAGFDEHLSKPMRKADFLHVVHRRLRGVEKPSAGELSSPSDRPGDDAASGPPARQLPVRVDPALKPLVPEFLRAMDENAIAVSEHLRREDFASIRNLGHRMKGDGGTYGFEALASLGARIQSAAERNDGEGVRVLLGELTSYLRLVETA
jgi:CheY-like chemotaxis protein